MIPENLNHTCSHTQALQGVASFKDPSDSLLDKNKKTGSVLAKTRNKLYCMFILCELVVCMETVS